MLGADVVAEYLAREEVPYVVGLPGHAISSTLDAIGRRGLKILQAKSEEGACHLADGFFRASGRPLVVFTTAGAGATNTVLGVATAYVDSSSLILLTGDVSTYFYGYGTFQSVERGGLGDFNSIIRPVVKGSFRITSEEQIADTLHRAFKLALTGRPGPVHVSIPMDIALREVEAEIPEPARRKPHGRIRGDEEALKNVAKLLVHASRPAILAGGGVAISGASDELVELAEYLGIPILTTELGLGKGVIPEDHELCAYYPGVPGSSVGNAIASTADVILAVGCRFTEFVTSSYKRGVTFNIPPTKLIQIDIDPAEIGKNYPVELGIVSDAKAALRDILAYVKELTPKRDYRGTEYFMELKRLREEWFRDVEKITSEPSLTIATLVKELREVLDRTAIVVTSTSYSISVVSQLFPVYMPRCHIASGGFGPMGFALPAALGAKLARRDRQVVAVDGDGSFLFRVGELATAVQYDIPVLTIVCNNAGFISVKDSQVYMFDRSFAVDFMTPDGRLYRPDYAKIAEAFRCHGETVRRREEVKEAVKRCLSSGRPAVIDAVVARDFPKTGTKHYGFWHGVSKEPYRPR
ncbi:Acetolactate synthase large subunit [archaeon HR01]|nr:Acetolactate synthase large subunit [archaeon HR01]